MAEKNTFPVNSTVIYNKKGFRREFNCRYTSEQNGVAERKNQSIIDAARAMLEEKSMPKFYWAGRSERPSTSRTGSVTRCLHTSCAV